MSNRTEYFSPIDRSGVVKLLRESLRIEVTTTSEYTGGDPMYTNRVTLSLTLDNEVISEVTL